MRVCRKASRSTARRPNNNATDHTKGCDPVYETQIEDHATTFFFFVRVASRPVTTLAFGHDPQRTQLSPTIWMTLQKPATYLFRMPAIFFFLYLFYVGSDKRQIESGRSH